MAIAVSPFGIPQFPWAANMEAFVGLPVELASASLLQSLPLPHVARACAGPISAS